MYIADLHIHSKYSRATSSDCDAPHLDLWARRKGIGLVGTGDFTHPVWRSELREMLEPAGGGVYALRKEFALPSGVAGGGDPVRFVVSGEISTIYKKDGKTRKVHHVILLPGLDEAEELAHRLEAVGNLHSDGRPILGMDSRDLLQMTMDACPDAIFIPAHIWTPHFSVFGEFSQFSTLEECYGDMTGCIHALETGLSSDPPMNRRVSQLDSYLLVSNSDAHSPQAGAGSQSAFLRRNLWRAETRAGDRRGLRGDDRVFPGGGQVPSGRPPGLRLLSGAGGNQRPERPLPGLRTKADCGCAAPGGRTGRPSGAGAAFPSLRKPDAPAGAAGQLYADRRGQ